MIYAWHYRGSTATAITGLSLALVTCALAIKGWLGTALELSAVMTGATLILLGGVVTHQFGEFITGALLVGPVAGIWLIRYEHSERLLRIY